MGTKVVDIVEEVIGEICQRALDNRALISDQPRAKPRGQGARFQMVRLVRRDYQGWRPAVVEGTWGRLRDDLDSGRGEKISCA